jgi:hypothetical protein
MLSAGFEPVIPVTKRPQTYALNREATGIGKPVLAARIKFLNIPNKI